MTNNKLYARDEYLKKKAADSNGLNIQLTNNYAFRKTFKNTYIAKGFLMALLGLKEDEIADLKVTDPFEEGESEQEKEGILDIKTGKEYNDKLQFHVVQLKKLEDAIAFKNVSNMPARVKCALLAWHTTEDMLNKNDENGKGTINCCH